MIRIAVAQILMVAAMMQVRAQEDTSQGIHFIHNLSWQKVLQKARAENKYVFVDCYATWCGPCKEMDQTVYPEKAVGDLYNKDFICVKLQIDRTSQDDESVKSWYETAQSLESTYRIGAYPTFLFFDPSGLPVHKVVGYNNAANFIQLGSNAKNPAKQYYAILKNFKPGKIDTASEKGLARSLYYTDPGLAGKLAFDYLRQIPKAQLGIPDNLELMIMFRENTHIRQFAGDYINKALERSFFEKPMLYFLFNFATLQDRGFKFIFDHAPEIDTIMQYPDWAQSTIVQIIEDADFLRLLKAAEKAGNTPNFDSIENIISSHFGRYYSDRVIQDGKFDWYNFQVNEKKQSQFWTDLIKVDISREERIWDEQKDRNPVSARALNNVCDDIFLHSDDTLQLNLALKWMEQVIQVVPEDPDIMDTYARVLYKSGKIQDALQEEEKVLNLCIQHRKLAFSRMQRTTLAIQRMWKGNEKIWTENEFQD